MAAPLQLLGGELEVHLGLAGTRNSPQQQPTPGRKLLVGIDHGMLLSGQSLGMLPDISTRSDLVLSQPTLTHQVTLLNQGVSK